MEAVNLVNGFVTHVEESCRIPHRAFSKTKTRADHAEFGVAIHQIPELGRHGLQAKFAGSGCWSAWRLGCQEQRGRDDKGVQDFHAAIHSDAFLFERNLELNLERL